MKKFYVILILLSFITFSLKAQKVILVPDEEINIPTDNPWGLTYHNDWFWVSDAENGNIVKVHRYLDGFSKIKAPREHITGLTFEGDFLWVLSDEWDTIAFPWMSSQKSLLFKLNPETGEVLDTLLIPYYFWTGPKDSAIYAENGFAYSSYRYLMGLSYYDSSLFVSYNGGWGPCLYRVEISNNHITEICCPHPSGMETVNEELWAIRDYPWEIVYADSMISTGSDSVSGGGTTTWPVPVMRNSIVPLIIKDSLAKEDWERQLEFDLYASDLAWDGTNFWLLDPWEKKIKRMVPDTVYPDTIHYCFEIKQLAIIPENPTVADCVKVVCHSSFTSGGCDMTNYTVEMDGMYDPTGATGGIHVNAYHEVDMLTYICESIDTIPIGKLNAGYHFLDYSLTATNLNCGSITQYLDFFVNDTTKYPVYLEIIPEQPVAGEEVKIVTHGVCYLNTWIDINERHITLYAYYNSCMMWPCGIDTLSLGFLTEDSYTLDYYLMDMCLPFPADSLVYYDYFEFDVKGATGIKEQSDRQVNIYPNPASEQLFIELNDISRNLDVEIYNMTGQLIKNEIFHNISTIEMDVSGLTKGIYILKLNTDKETFNTRIIIQ
jgi:hypothetical protein